MFTDAIVIVLFDVLFCEFPVGTIVHGCFGLTSFANVMGLCFAVRGVSRYGS